MTRQTKKHNKKQFRGVFFSTATQTNGKFSLLRDPLATAVTISSHRTFGNCSHFPLINPIHHIKQLHQHLPVAIHNSNLPRFLFYKPEFTLQQLFLDLDLNDFFCSGWLPARERKTQSFPSDDPAFSLSMGTATVGTLPLRSLFIKHETKGACYGRGSHASKSIALIK